jgi:hypothetical protein
MMNHGLAQRLGAGAKKRAQQRFNLQRFVADWDSALRSVC